MYGKIFSIRQYSRLEFRWEWSTLSSAGWTTYFSFSSPQLQYEMLLTHITPRTWVVFVVCFPLLYMLRIAQIESIHGPQGTERKASLQSTLVDTQQAKPVSQPKPQALTRCGSSQARYPNPYHWSCHRCAYGRLWRSAVVYTVLSALCETPTLGPESTCVSGNVIVFIILFGSPFLSLTLLQCGA